MVLTLSIRSHIHISSARASSAAWFELDNGTERRPLVDMLRLIRVGPSVNHWTISFQFAFGLWQVTGRHK